VVATVGSQRRKPLISSSSLLLMTARRLRDIVICLLQGSNAEAAPTSSPLLHQHQLLPPLPGAAVSTLSPLPPPL
jgi:hypothetical protein